MAIDMNQAEKLNNEDRAYSICSVCMGVDRCTYAVNQNVPLLHCAEFKPYPSRPTIHRHTKPAESKIVSDYVGLCKNCDTQSDCAHFDQEKYVVNCEEYQ